MLTPFTTAVGEQVLERNHSIVTGAFVVTGVFNGLSQFLRWDVLHEQHSQAADRYADLIEDCNEVLCKKRKYRSDVDITIQNFKNRYTNLMKQAPSLKKPAEDSTVEKRDGLFSVGLDGARV